MKKIYSILVFFCCLFGFEVNAQHIAVDINTASVGGLPLNITRGEDYFVYTAMDIATGRELYISDGTQTGTKLLGDFSKGTESSNFIDVSIIDTTCYFVIARDPTTIEFWSTRLDKPNPQLFFLNKTTYISAGQIGQFFKQGGSIYFTTRNASNIMELWKTNGPKTTTSLVFQFPIDNIPSNFTQYKDYFLFTSRNINGINQIWRTNGNTDNTYSITNFDNNTSITGIAVFKNLAYFGARNDVDGYEPYVTDGTAAGTKLFKDINPGNANSGVSNFTVLGNNMFFTASDNNNGYELWRTDGTPANTYLVKDIKLGAGSANPFQLRAFKQQIFFLADDGFNGVELWRSDGTYTGTQLVSDIYNGMKSAFSDGRLVGIESNNQFYFAAQDSVNGRELWQTDGTTTGTKLLKDISVGKTSSNILSMINFKNQIYFNADDIQNGNEIWVSNGQASGTEIFTRSKSVGIGSNPKLIKILKNKLFFIANTKELWISDGTPSGTKLVKDLQEGTALIEPQQSVIFTESYFFTTINKETFKRSLWKSDGTKEGTIVLKEFNTDFTPFSQTIFEVVNNKLVFDGFTTQHGRELWITDGTISGTTLLKDINPIGNSSPIVGSNAVIFEDSILFFQAHDGRSGVELWRTNGTTEGTTMVADINDGDASLTTYNYHISNMVKIGNKILFSANNSLYGRELWISDGTTAGTKLVKDIWPGPNSSIISWATAYKDKVYFSALNEQNGKELWVSDGTTEGTMLFVDLLLGGASSSPFKLTVHDSDLYFVIDNNEVGSDALWKTNGTKEGTVLVYRTNLTIPFNSKSLFSTLYSYKDNIYFTATDGINGQELWITDGTKPNSKLVLDINKGSASSNCDQFTTYKDDLFFVADDGIHGRELWRMNFTTTSSFVESNQNDLLIYPNPAQDILTIKISNDRIAKISIFDVNGRMVYTKQLTSSQLELNISGLGTGLYFVDCLDSESGDRLSKKLFVYR